MQGQHEESRLLKRAREYDEEALTWIYQNYHDAIYRYIYHRIGELQTAQDLAAEVFRRFLQALRNGGGPTRQLKPWLYRVAHNMVVDELRRRQHRNHESLDGTLGEFLKAENDSLDELVGTAIASESVRDALMSLTDEQCQVVILKYLEGMSNAEVAEISGKTIGAVKALQHRALDTLRAQITASEALARDASLDTGAWMPSFGR